MEPKKVDVDRRQMALASFCKNTKNFHIVGSITVLQRPQGVIKYFK